jgi:hypothetical protein
MIIPTYAVQCGRRYIVLVLYQQFGFGAVEVQHQYQYLYQPAGNSLVGPQLAGTEPVPVLQNGTVLVLVLMATSFLLVKQPYPAFKRLLPHIHSRSP